MKAVNYTITKVNVDIELLSIVLRTTYLIMDSIAAAGDTAMCIHVVEIYKQVTLKDKIKMLENCFSGVGLEESLNVMVIIKNAYKQMQTIKHPDRKVLIAYNKLMHNIEPIYDKHIEMVVSGLKMDNLVELKGILDTNTFLMLEVVSDKEIKFKENRNKITPTMLLQSIQANKDEEHRILVIPSDLINSEFIKGKKVYQYNDPEAIDENEIYLYKCFTMPAPVSLTGSQLKAIRGNIRDTAINFNNALTEWCKCFTNKDDAKSKLEKFVNEVTCTLQAIQTAIDNNSILQFIKTTDKENSIYVNVWIGEVPLPTVWLYYKTNEMISEECYNSLLSALELNAELKNRIPIMVIDTEGAFSNDSENDIQAIMTEELLAFTRRKFIHVN